MLVELSIFALVLGVVVAYVKAKPPRKNYPPGPPITPFLGNLKYITGNSKVHKTFIELKKKYGPIFSLQLGWYPHIVISDYKLIKEALVDNGNQFAERFSHSFAMRLQPHAKHGVIFGEGELWKRTRRLALSSLRDFGFGKATMEYRILTETEVLIKEIAKYRGEPFNFDLLFNKAGTNVVSAMLFDKRWDYNDPEFIEMLTALTTFMQKGILAQGTRLFLPYALPVVFLSPTAYKIYKVWDTMGKFVKKQITEHRQNFDSNKIKDFVDVYLDAEQKNAEDATFFDQNLFKTILDLLLGGADTVSTTLLWGILFMLKHPDIQEKCRQEILEVVGSNSQPSFKDKDKMPYVEATICEIQRLGNTAPIVLRAPKDNIEFHGYVLPKLTAVSIDFYSVHMDPDLWEDPEQFKPERFLDEDYRVVKPPYLLPFGLGKRVCLGENLAKVELFLFFTSLLQNYKFTCADRDKLPSAEDGNMGFTYTPGPYQVMANPV